MQLHTIGIDLGKTLFHLVGLNQRGEVVVRKKFSRKQLLQFTAKLQAEACGGSFASKSSPVCSYRPPVVVGAVTSITGRQMTPG